MNIEQLTHMFFLMSAINVGLLFLSVIGALVLRKFALSIHKKLFDLSEDALKKEYFGFIAKYKLLVIVFNIVPFIALKLMA